MHTNGFFFFQESTYRLNCGQTEAEGEEKSTHKTESSFAVKTQQAAATKETTVTSQSSDLSWVKQLTFHAFLTQEK